jgi:uncharacterized membrane protein YraQ (UPF0718 family)
MAWIFRKEEHEKVTMQTALTVDEPKRSLWKNALFFASMIGILLFANFCCPKEETESGILWLLYGHGRLLTSLCAIALGVMLVLWFDMKWWKVVAVAVPVAVLAYLFPHDILIPFVAATLGLSLITSTDKGECGEWFAAPWSFAKMILPLLLAGVFVAGLLLGSGGESGADKGGLIPSEWIAWALGGNTIRANFFASFAGALMYFATLTEVPIVEGLIANGMGRGPALALLLAGPSLSLPSMLVIYSVLGFKKTAVFVALVMVSSMAFGMAFGCFCL